MKKLTTVALILFTARSFAQTGNIGIGTTNPKAQLEVTGSARFDTLRGSGIRLLYVSDSGNLTTTNSNIFGNYNSYAIPDASCTGVSSIITVTGLSAAVPSSNVQVRVNVIHPFISDVYVYLISPSGQILNLVYQANGGGPGNHANLKNTIFKDGAAALNSSIPPYSGTYSPVGSTATAYNYSINTSCGFGGTVTSFSGFGATVVPNGNWTLKVMDLVAGDVGTLSYWNISFDGNDLGAPVVSANFVPKGATGGFLVTSSIYDNGNVGIGTTTPAAKLDVSGTLNATTYNGNGASLTGLVNLTTNQAIGGTKTFSSAITAPSFNGDGTNLTGVVNTTTAQTVIGIKTFSNNLIANGSIGIGTTSPATALDVSGTITALSAAGNGVSGTTNANSAGIAGIKGAALNGANAAGVLGNTAGGYGVRGEATSASAGYGVYGTAAGGTGVRGVATAAGGYGVSGTSVDAVGVFGETISGTGVYGIAGIGGAAGLFVGNVQVNGSLAKSAGSFKIDHPLDPANKYLYHSFVESPDMKNIYDGMVTTDAQGFATITMPDWFGALNRDFRYQLTTIGTFAQAIVKEEMSGNTFIIQTSQPNVKVSWQVTGIRQDKYANAHRIPVEENKAAEDRGRYLSPDVYGQPASEGIGRKRNVPAARH